MSNRFASIVPVALFAFLIGCGAAAGPAEEPVSEQPVVTAPTKTRAPIDTTPDQERVSLNTQETTNRRSGGVLRVRKLLTSPALEVQTNVAIKPTSSFRKRIKKVYASFTVTGLEAGGTIRVLFYRDESLIEEFDIESEGEKRYAAALENPKGLARGDYAVEVEVEGDMFARRTFFVGDTNIGPAVERAALGTALNRNRMPKRQKKVFKRGTPAIRCGLSLLSLPDDATVEVQWVALKDNGEKLLHTTETKVQQGGSSTVGMTWKPGGKLSLGPHKAVILVNKRKLEELPFIVK